MVIQKIDGSLVHESDGPRRFQSDKQTFYAEVPHHLLDEIGELLERVISFAFDVAGARHVELRVYDPE